MINFLRIIDQTINKDEKNKVTNIIRVNQYY